MQLRPEDDELYKSKYRDKFDEFPLPETYKPFRGKKSQRLPEEIWNGVILPSYDYVNKPVYLRERMVRIGQTVTGVDRMIGHVREELKRLNLDDNTIIVFSTDHGIHHGEHGLGGKCFLYEEDLHIPLIIYDPRLPEELQGQKRDEMVVVPDLAPTVMELTDTEVPETMDGESLLPLIKDTAQNWRKDFFAEQLMDIQNYPKSECIRSKDWKYIRYFHRTEDPAQKDLLFRGTLDNYNDFLNGSLNGKIKPGYEELFHLKEDPYEKNNLALNPDYEEKLKEMRHRLIKRGKEVKKPEGEPLTLDL